MNSAEIDIDGMQKTAKRLVENFHMFSKHMPKMLRDTAMLAYTKAVDEMFMAMDHNKVTGAIQQDLTPKVILLDDKGFAAT